MNTLATFPVCLVGSEMDHATGQSSFLIHPPAFIEHPAHYVSCEIVHGFAEIELTT